MSDSKLLTSAGYVAIRKNSTGDYMDFRTLSQDFDSSVRLAHEPRIRQDQIVRFSSCILVETYPRRTFG